MDNGEFFKREASQSAERKIDNEKALRLGSERQGLFILMEGKGAGGVGLKFTNAICEGHELLHGELFRAEVEEGIGEEGLHLVAHALALQRQLGEERTEVVAQGLAALVEGGLHDTLEQGFVAAKGLRSVARQADDGRADLGGRIEHVGLNGEQVRGFVPRLNEHGEDAVGLRAGAGTDAVGHLLLDHAGAAGYQFLVVQHLKEDLAGDIIGIVAGEHEGLPAEDAVQVHLQEIVLDDIVLQLRPRAAQVGHGLEVQLHDFQRTGLAHQVLRHHSHAGSYLQHRQVRTGIYGVRNTLGDV